MKIKISKTQWIEAGKKAGWIKMAQSEDYRMFMDSLSADNPAKIKPVIHMVTNGNLLLPKADFDKIKLLRIAGEYRFDRLPEEIRRLAYQLWKGNEFFGSNDQTSGYSLLIDGKSVERYISELYSDEKVAQNEQQIKIAQMRQSYDPKLVTDEAKVLWHKINDYLIMADDPKFEVIRVFRSKIEKVKDPTDREELKKYFESEFSGSHTTQTGAWEYYK